MKNTIFLILYFVHALAYGQEKELITKISEVTVYLNGAQVNREGSLNLSPGKHALILKGLSPYIDENSIQVKAKGDFTILSVNHRLNYLEAMYSEDQDKINLKIQELDKQINLEKARLEVNKEKVDLLNKNKTLGSEASGSDINRLKEAMVYFEEQLTRIKNNDLDIQWKIAELEKEKMKYQNQLEKPMEKGSKPTGEIVISIDSEQNTNAEFTISYLTSKAGWFPKYDVRASDIDSPVILDYKARVYQNTGIDWLNVKLVLSNTNPSQSGIAPELDPWQLNYAEYTVTVDPYQFRDQIREVRGRVVDSETGSPLPGVNVIVEGSTVGTNTDGTGYYSLAVPSRGQRLIYSFVGMVTQRLPINQSVINVNMEPDVTSLSEVVVAGYAPGRAKRLSVERQLEPESDLVQPVVTVMMENQTSVSFVIEKPYTVKSQDESLMVDIRKYETPAIYKYFAVPKIDPDAFLIASIVDWDQYGLLEGEANLYFEGTYIGKTILDVRVLSDTLDLSLGRDKNVIIERERVDEYTKKRFIGNNKVDTRGIRIRVRNNKSQPVELLLKDQIPVSVRSEITVDIPETSGADLDKDTGIMEWNLNLQPQQQTELIFRYEVKYPKNEKVILE